MWFWILGWILVFLTVIGNGFIIYLVITKPRLHTTQNWFILSLAVADLCAGLSFFPPIFFVKFGFFTINLTHAGVFFKICFTFFYCSNASVFAMTVDRFLAITRPLRYVSFMTRETIWVMIIAAWMTPVLLFGLPAIFTYRDNPGYTLFVEISRVIIFQIFPFVVFIIATCRLLHLAWKLNRQTQALVAQVKFNRASGDIVIQPPPPRSNTRASTVLIVVIMTAFNITYLGGNYRCICLLTNLCPFAGTLRFIIYLVLIANSAVNPIFYAFLKSDIRRELRDMFSR
ncbi:beta-3 adrenergic receptor-like [Oculina patagonica]